MQPEVKIEDLVEGTGKAAERGALITAHYRGWLEDGTEFDSSYKRGMIKRRLVGLIHGKDM